MKGDFTRLTFDKTKHYRGVLQQQGRVQLDSDWNEQVQIAEHRYSTFFSDFVGQSGAPAEGVMWLDQGWTTALSLGDDAFIQVNERLRLDTIYVGLWFRVNNQVFTSGVQCLLHLGELVAIGIRGSELFAREDQEDWDRIQDNPLVQPGLEENNWNHLGVLITKSTVGRIKIQGTVFLNGNRIGSILDSGSQVLESLERLTVGALGVSAEGNAHIVGGTAHFEGSVAELQIWMTESGTVDWSQIGLSGKEDGLVLYYPLDEPTGAERAVDHGPSKINATIWSNVTRCQGPGKTPISLSNGRYYVDGLLVENEEENHPLPGLTEGDGLYLAYLDVWTGHVTAAEDETLREPALGGPDTTTRLKTQWQLRCARLGDLAAFIDEYKQRYWRDWPRAEAIKYDWERPLSTGTIVSVEPGSARLADNRLYRIEVHQSGTSGTATFKWSRDNGATLARLKSVEGADHKTLVLDNPNQATLEAFRGAQYVEVADQDCGEDDQPGVMAQLAQTFVEDHCLLVDNWVAEGTPAFAQGITVRRWDSAPTPLKAGKISLGSELEVAFSRNNSYYRSGDYWLIPVRAGAIIDWDKAEAGKPHGVEHHYAALGLVRKQDQEIEFVNLQTVFQPLTAYDVNTKGNVCIGGKLGVGFEDPKFLQAPLNVVAFEGALANFQAPAGTTAWHIRHETTGNQPALRITTGGGNGLTLQQDGNVGIGETAPGAKLEVNVNDTDTKPLIIKKGTSEYLTILNNGNVGIGEQVPQNKLDVKGSAVIGATHAGMNTAPTNGLLVEGNVGIGIGAKIPDARLHIAVDGTDTVPLIVQKGTVNYLTVDSAGQISIGDIAQPLSFELYGSTQDEGPAVSARFTQSDVQFVEMRLGSYETIQDGINTRGNELILELGRNDEKPMFSHLNSEIIGAGTGVPQQPIPYRLVIGHYRRWAAYSDMVTHEVVYEDKFQPVILIENDYQSGNGAIGKVVINADVEIKGMLNGHNP